MGKRLWITVLISLFCCLPVFGQDSFYGQNDIEQTGEALVLEQDKQENARKDDTRETEESLYTGANVLEEICTGLKETARVLADKAAVEQKQQGNRWGIFLTPAEVDLLARIVMLEAGGETALGQQAVTEVILNRMVSPYYGGSLEHVLSAKGQFSTWKYRYSAQAAPTPQVIASVTAVLNGETNILPFQTLYFSRRPQNSRVQIRIGRHAFCNQ